MKQGQLRSMSANVARIENGYRLTSYSSVVIDVDVRVDNPTIILYDKWEYSVTTCKHVRTFLHDYLCIDIGVPAIRELLKGAEPTINGYKIIRDTNHYCY